jgi:hypothetical protein
LGAQITLEKPFSRKDIIEAVNELITSEGDSSER